MLNFNLIPDTQYNVKLYIQHKGVLRLTNGYTLEITSRNNILFEDYENNSFKKEY